MYKTTAGNMILWSDLKKKVYIRLFTSYHIPMDYINSFPLKLELLSLFKVKSRLQLEK